MQNIPDIFSIALSTALVQVTAKHWIHLSLSISLYFIVTFFSSFITALSSNIKTSSGVLVEEHNVGFPDFV